MSIDFTRLLQDEITYWALGGTNAQGFQTFESPKLLKGRWEDRVESTTDDQGQEIRANSVVFLAQSVGLGGYLYQGDATSTSDPTTLKDAKVIVEFRSTPPLSGEPSRESECTNRALVRG